MATAKSAEGVSIIVRTIGGRDVSLGRALASLRASVINRPLQVVVVYQGSDRRQLDRLHSMQEDPLVGGFEILQNAASGDRRAENLNLGWAFAGGRYIGFLDDDDSVEPDHLEKLVELLESTGRAWAFGQSELVIEDAEMRVISRSTPFARRKFSYTELLVENFVPINSVLIDRARLAPELLAKPFCEQLQRSEDWDFLIRLAYYHQPAVQAKVTSTYFIKAGGDNSNTSLGTDSLLSGPENAAAWATSKAMVEGRMQQLLAQSPRSAEYEAALAHRGRAGLPRRAFRRLRNAFDRWNYSSRRALRKFVG